MDSDTPQNPLAKTSSTAPFTPPVNPSQYIRTYAKDVAQYAVTPEAAAEAAAAHVPDTAPLPREEPAPIVAAMPSTTEDGVSLPEFDSSPINNESDPASPKEFKQEVVDLLKSDSDGLFTGEVSPSLDAPVDRMRGPIPTSSTAPMMPQGSIGIAPVVPSVDVEPLTAPVQDAALERESILARLREKVASHPQPVITRPEPISIPTPEFANVPEPVVSMPQVRKEAVVPVIQTPPPAGPSSLHTYSSDFAERIDDQKSSTFTVLAAQSDAVPVVRTTRTRSRALVPLLSGVAMLIIGIGAVLGAYLYSQDGTPVPMVANIPSLIRFDESVEVKGDDDALKDAIAQVAGGATVSGNIIVTYVTGADAAETANIPQPGGVLIKRLSLSAPDILLRNLDQSSTVGVINAGAESRPFMLLKVNSYERTFAGMLAWEPTMSDELSPFYPAYAGLPTTPASSTASSTVQVTSTTKAFTDGVVANYNVRVLRDQAGRSLLLYGYKGKDLLVVTRDEAAFTALVNRLNAAGE